MTEDRCLGRQKDHCNKESHCMLIAESKICSLPYFGGQIEALWQVSLLKETFTYVFLYCDAKIITNSLVLIFFPNFLVNLEVEC